MYLTTCENCRATISKSDGHFTTNLLNYMVCDSCESTLCAECIGDFNECPKCEGELTIEENF